MVSPRVGFSWYTDEEHRTLIRGGVGIFTGRVPFVWLSNSFNNTGMEQKGTTLQPRMNRARMIPMKLLHWENTRIIRWLPLQEA